ncbi:hypothetical protein Hdeb2414_s0005g00170081 [Helianthus debilis subsp. tardiflorus]
MIPTIYGVGCIMLMSHLQFFRLVTVMEPLRFCLLLGGDDFDKRIVDWLATSFKKDGGVFEVSERLKSSMISASLEDACHLACSCEL